MPAKVVMIQPLLGAYAPWLVERVRAPIEVAVAPSFRDEDVLPLLPDAEIAITSHWSREWGSAATRLRFIQMPGAGWDKIDAAAVPAGVLVANCYEHERAIAEYVIMACLALSRQLLPADRSIRRASWRHFPAVGPARYSELGSRTIGTIGFGRIGREVAALAAPFGMRRIAVDPLPVPDELRERLGLAWVGWPESLDRLLEEADFAVLAAPLNDRTRGMLGARELRLLKPGAFLINPARAELVDERALYEALRARWFAGAALDAWWREPTTDECLAPSRFPFAELDNVIMTPHSSGSTEETFRRRMEVVAANLDRFLQGEPVLNVVEVLSRR